MANETMVLRWTPIDEDVRDWCSILTEEFAEAMAETDRAKLRAELVQVAAAAVAWIEDLDSRSADG